MKQKLFILLNIVFSLAITANSDAQIAVTGKTNTTPNLAATYTTLAAAITDLNSISSISGPVTLTVTTSSYTETAPAGGYQITMSSITNTSSSPVVIDGDHKTTITAYSPQASGSLIDAVFKIIGADYITIQKFTMRENTSNTTVTLASNNMTEWGVALLRASTTNGAQYNSIIDNDIQLDRTYSNSFGIYSNVRHTATNVTTSIDITNNTTGPNHGNAIYSNRISNVNMGIVFIGSNTDDRMDNYNDIGGSSTSTGNTVTDWGASSLPTGTFTGNMGGEYYGILMRCEKNNNMSWNTVIDSTALSGSTAAPIRGIHNGTTTSTVTGTFTTTINHNMVRITDSLPNGTSSTSRVDGILSTDKLGSGTLSMSYNTVSGLAVTTSGSNRQIRCIGNSASAAKLFINENKIVGNTSTATATAGSFTAIEQTGAISDSIEIVSNQIGDSTTATPAISYSATANANATLSGINHNPASNPGGTSSIQIVNNSFYGFVTVNSPANKHSYIYCDHTTTTNSEIIIGYNHFINLVARTSGDVVFIGSSGTMAASAGAKLIVFGNEITGTFTKSLSGGDVYLYNAYGNSATGDTMVEAFNNFSNISLTGTTLMHGWYNNEGATATGPLKVIANNRFDNWACGTTGTSSTAYAIYCDWASDSSEISGNTISNIMAYCELDAIYSASNTAVTLNANRLFRLDAMCMPLHSVTMGNNSSAGNGGIYLDPSNATEVIGYTFTNSITTGTRGLYYNTVFINATAPTSTDCMPPPTNFTTACQVVRANSDPTKDRIILRNNIYINTSEYKGTGKAACILNKGSLHSTTIPNYSSPTNISNNNVFWVGTRSTESSPPTSTILEDAHHLIYYDNRPTNATYDMQTVDAFKAYVGAPADVLSFSFIPDFVSAIVTTLYPTADLDLQFNDYNCPVLDHGNSAGIYAPIAAFDGPIYGHTKRLIVCPFITDIGCDQRIKTYTWTGTNSTDWNDPNNWDLYALNPPLYTYPDNTDETAYIPAVTSGNQPENASATRQVDNLLTQCSATPRVYLLRNLGTIKLAKQILGPFGTITNHDDGDDECAIVGSIELNGSCSPQTIDGNIFIPGIVGGDVKNFTASNTSNISPNPNPKVIVIPTNGELNVYGELGFGASDQTLSSSPAMSDYGITLKSGEFCPGVFTTANVAKIDPLSSNFISGNVRVERFIHTGDSPGHTKKWQLLATPTGANGSGQSVYDSWQEGGNNASTGYGTHIADTRSNWLSLGFDAQSVNSDNGINTWNTGSQDFDPIPSPGTSIPLYNKTGYFLFVRGDRSKDQLASLPNPTNMRSKGSLFQPHTGYAPPDVAVPVTALASMPIYQFAMIGNPYASAIDILYMDSHTGYFNNLTNDVYVWDPLLAGAHGLGGYQTLVESLGYQAEPGTTALYDYHTTHYPEIQSGQAFFMTTNANSTAGSVHFDESVKSPNSRLVTKNANISNKTVLKARLYFNQKITDGNAVIFDNAYSNKIDANDAIKFPNPGENFMIRTANHLLAAETRQPVAESDSIFYELKNIEPVPYQLQFVPENFNTVGLQAFLIDNYLHTTTTLSLSENSLIDFKADNNKASYEHRFIVVFQRTANPEAKASDIKPAFVIYPNPVSDRIINIRSADQSPGSYDIQLVSRGGQVVYRGTLEINDANTINSIKIGKVAIGNYDVIITADDGKKSVQQILIK